MVSYSTVSAIVWFFVVNRHSRDVGIICRLASMGESAYHFAKWLYASVWVEWAARNWIASTTSFDASLNHGGDVASALAPGRGGRTSMKRVNLYICVSGPTYKYMGKFAIFGFSM